MRSYAEYCSLAKSLDVVGGRWTLLIIRELTLRGPSRYTDLRDGLPGITSNLLAERLRDLEQAGVVEREDAPPPIATTLYRLTPRGQQLQPTLEALVRWGVPLMVEEDPAAAVRGHWLAWAIQLMLSDRQPGAGPASVELQADDQPIALELRDGRVEARVGRADNPDATVSGPPRLILGLLLGLLELADAEAGGVEFEGDRGILDRLGAEVEPAASPS